MITERKSDVLVVGGGVIGMSCAYYLAQAGVRTTLIESTTVGSPFACSYGNQGLVCPSHAVPLAAPGVISQDLKWLFDPTSPLYIRNPWRYEICRWLWRFTRSSGTKRAKAATAHMAQFLTRSAQLHSELSTIAETDTATESHPYGYTANGMMHVFMSEKLLHHHLNEARQLERHGIKFQYISGNEIRNIEPALSTKIVGGALFPGDAHVAPQSFVKFLYSHARAAGAQIIEHTDVIHIQPYTSNSGTAVLTTHGEFTADQIVIAAGSWSPNVAVGLNLPLPIQAAKGYSITFTRPSWRPRLPISMGDSQTMITPLPQAIRIGGTLELAGLDRSVRLRRVQAILDSTTKFIPGIQFDGHAPDAELWSGLRPLAPDTLPIIGRPRAHSNIIVATGHGTLGVSLGPATGEAVTSMVTGTIPPVNLRPYNPDRFTISTQKTYQ